jgi:hypothetical protein
MQLVELSQNEIQRISGSIDEKSAHSSMPSNIEIYSV